MKRKWLACLLTAAVVTTTLLGCGEMCIRDRIREAAAGYWDLTSPSDLRSYFREPVLCLLRIEKSIALWTEEGGANGYFAYLEQTIGAVIPRDLKMNFSVQVKQQP